MAMESWGEGADKEVGKLKQVWTMSSFGFAPGVQRDGREWQSDSRVFERGGTWAGFFSGLA